MNNSPTNFIIKNQNIHEQNNRKISIVMAYHNRRDQILFTLKTIEDSAYKNFEVIIIDDNSNEKHMLDADIKNFDINIIYVKLTKKTTINPCMNYNMGFRIATGDIIIIQNPECCHIGDLLSYVDKNIKKNEYFSFTCANMYNDELNSKLYKIYQKDRESLSSSVKHCLVDKPNVLKFILGIPGVVNDIPWYNHPDLRREAFHFCTTIMKSDLDQKLGGGFDSRYKEGSGYDDAEIVQRIKASGMEIKFFYPDVPYAIHQWHAKTSTLSTGHLINLNRLVFNQHMKELGINKFYETI